MRKGERQEKGVSRLQTESHDIHRAQGQSLKETPSISCLQNLLVVSLSFGAFESKNEILRQTSSMLRQDLLNLGPRHYDLRSRGPYRCRQHMKGPSAKLTPDSISFFPVMFFFASRRLIQNKGFQFSAPKAPNDSGTTGRFRTRLCDKVPSCRRNMWRYFFLSTPNVTAYIFYSTLYHIVHRFLNSTMSTFPIIFSLP